jgi:hypothetical protein
MDKVIPENEINSPDAPDLDGYLLKDSLEHQKITGFITPWLNKKNPFTLFYKGSLFVGFMFIGGLAGFFLTSDVMSISTILFHFFGGVFLSFFLIFILPGQWIILLSSVLVSHAGFCVGDFVLLGYMYEHRDEGILTLDVLEHEKSYFYVKDKN